VLFFACDDQQCQHPDESVLEHWVVIHDDGHHAHVWQEPARTTHRGLTLGVKHWVVQLAGGVDDSARALGSRS
jgi:hypothetical protein